MWGDASGTEARSRNGVAEHGRALGACLTLLRAPYKGELSPDRSVFTEGLVHMSSTSCPADTRAASPRARQRGQFHHTKCTITVCPVTSCYIRHCPITPRQFSQALVVSNIKLLPWNTLISRAIHTCYEMEGFCRCSPGLAAPPSFAICRPSSWPWASMQTLIHPRGSAAS